MVAGRPRLGCFLIESGVITEEQLDRAVEHQVSTGCRLGEALIALGFCSDAEIAQALAEQLEIPFVDLYQTPPDPGCVALVPREVALQYGVVPIRMRGSRLLVAVRDPYDIRLDEAIRRVTNLQVVLALAPQSQLEEHLLRYWNETLFEEEPHPTGETEEVDTEGQPLSVEQLTAAGEQVSTVCVVNALIADGVRRGASDIHIEPARESIRVRYRIDGEMCPALDLALDQHQSVVARIKIMCGMDISENRKPQDGRCRARVDGQQIELRASTIRGIHGEIVVLRILNPDAGLHQLGTLGFEPEMLKQFRALLAGRSGMILVTGPTGSGKTTSLYAALNHLNRENLNIITVEDPVESEVEGANQIQVHERAGRSFASTLRAMLRQDPDILMVGEIRDTETADIACRAALTGHLVLSTLHTQHTLGTAARMLDMGVAPWVLASCLNGVLAQRLVRRVCEVCAEECTPSEGLLRALESHFGPLEGVRFRKGKGCSTCHRTGTRGRIGVYELLVVDEAVRHLLAERAGTEILRADLQERGFQPMAQDAFRKVCQGLIPPEEIINVGLIAATVESEG